MYKLVIVSVLVLKGTLALASPYQCQIFDLFTEYPFKNIKKTTKNFKVEGEFLRYHSENGFDYKVTNSLDKKTTTQNLKAIAKPIAKTYSMSPKDREALVDILEKEFSGIYLNGVLSYRKKIIGLLSCESRIKS